MNNTMKEIGYDAKKMPLGRLGDTTIKEAYGVLNQLSQAIKKKQKVRNPSQSHTGATLLMGGDIRKSGQGLLNSRPGDCS